MSDGEGKHREEPADPQDVDDAGALAALRRASIKARLRALEVSGSVAMYRDGKVVYESDPDVLFPDGMDPEAPLRD